MTGLRELFESPSTPVQRRYEAIRAVEVDNLSIADAAKKFGYKKGSMPMTEKLANSILALPSHQDLPSNDRVYVAEKIKEFYEKN